MVKPSSKERREHTRIEVQVEVSLESTTQLYTGLTGDLSEGGVFVPTWQEVPVGSEIDLELTLPNGTIRTRSVVRWRREMSTLTPDVPPGVGIGFLEMDDDARELLSEFCASREPLYYDVGDGDEQLAS
jgi:uncharacterized protein (TIGR02266 family)